MNIFGSKLDNAVRQAKKIFSARYYLLSYPELNLNQDQCWAHFLLTGGFENRDPCPMFSSAYYLERSDALWEGLNPLVHYCLHGVKRDLNPHPLFSTTCYRESAGLLADQNPLLDYYSDGPEFVECHPLFDSIYYSRQYLLKNGIEPTAKPLESFLSDPLSADPHPLFSVSFYLERYPDVQLSGMNPLIHYLAHGASEARDTHLCFRARFYMSENMEQNGSLEHFLQQGSENRKSPHPLFDLKFCAKKYQKLGVSSSNALTTYLRDENSHGIDPHPLFNTDWVRQQLPSYCKDVDPFLYYLEFGCLEDVNPNPLFENDWYVQKLDFTLDRIVSPLEHYVLEGESKNLETSPLLNLSSEGSHLQFSSCFDEDGRVQVLIPVFDSNWYSSRYPDVLAAGVEPVEHFLMIGWREGRDPHPCFDTTWYASKYVDVAKSGLNPLLHFCEFGLRELRQPSALFDTQYYVEMVGDIGSYLDPLSHYVMVGAKNGLSPSPYFNPAWYLQTYPDVASHLVDPFVHFLQFGDSEGRRPNEFFDTAWYRKTYMAGDRATNCLSHYIQVGSQAGYDPSPEFPCSSYLGLYPDVSSRGVEALKHFLLYGKNEKRLPTSQLATVATVLPLVSVIIVNFNGIEHLPDLLSSIFRQDYINFEVIFVDNNSEDDSCCYVSTSYPEVRIVRCAENLGFAEGVNVGFEVAFGDFIALINNDVVVDERWLGTMVLSLIEGKDIGAVGSKIRFWKKFIPIEIQIGSMCDASLNVSKLLSSMPVYKKAFFIEGFGDRYELAGDEHSKLSSFSRLLVPICDGQSNVRLIVEGAGLSHVKIQIDDQEQEWCLSDDKLEVELELRDQNINRRWVINNAGSLVSEIGDTKDIGFGEFDSEYYDTPRDVSALCGCSMLIRRDALAEFPVFPEYFFAYFEDTELSLRLRKAGWRLTYNPESLVYHKHAASSTENSAFFRYHVTRNRLLFLAMHFPRKLLEDSVSQAVNELDHLYHYYEAHSVSAAEREFRVKIPQLLSDLKTSLPKCVDGRVYSRKNKLKKVGVFNGFWNTLGGGEHHACQIAEALSEFGPVDLIGHEAFSIEDLRNQYNLSLKNCISRVVSPQELHHDERVTGEYDVFVNSSYSSDLFSYAKSSYYVVSFPFNPVGRGISHLAFLRSYKQFWVNSKFTERWTRSWWGEDLNIKLIYPAAGFSDVEERTKEKVFLNVGRFFESGHNKKQLEIVKAFRSLVDSKSIGSDWQLKLAGQVTGESEYYREVLELAEGYNIEVMKDLPFSSLRTLYASSSYYIHATGLDEDVDGNPQLFEHFGMTTVEAMSAGCVPAVIESGGQPEIVQDEFGYFFDDTTSLREAIVKCVDLFERDLVGFYEKSNKARIVSQNFSVKHLREQVRKSIEMEQDVRILGESAYE